MLAPIKSLFSQGILEKASKVRPPRPSMERGGCGKLVLLLYYSLLIDRKAKRGKQQEKKAISYS